MVDLGSISGYGETALNIGLLVVVIIICVSFVGAGLWILLKYLKYKEFSCRIWEMDGFGQWTETRDRAGIFVDRKTKNKRFFMKKANVGLSPDNVPYIPGGKGSKIVYLLRTGLKNFRYVNVRPANPSVALNVSEEDVNWAINAYERAKTTFTRDLFLQYLPFMILAFVCLIILVIFIYFFKNFDTLKDVALAFKEASASLAQSKAGTVVVQ